MRTVNTRSLEVPTAPRRESTPVEVEDETAGAAGIAAGGAKRPCIALMDPLKASLRLSCLTALTARTL